MWYNIYWLKLLKSRKGSFFAQKIMKEMSIGIVKRGIESLCRLVGGQPHRMSTAEYLRRRAEAGRNCLAKPPPPVIRRIQREDSGGAYGPSAGQELARYLAQRSACMRREILERASREAGLPLTDD